MRDVRLWIRLQEARSAQDSIAGHAQIVEAARLRRVRARREAAASDG
jgi:hypothetical protein